MKYIFTPPIGHCPNRQSNFELLRLYSQLTIVLYHILMMFVFPTTGNTLYKALWLPLHTGVIIFVLLSGYFSIKPSIKGFTRLIGVFFIYNLSEVIYNIIHAEGIRESFHQLLFLSNTHFWFIKTYLGLYLISPMINIYFQKTSKRQILYIAFVLWFITQYMAVTSGDCNMSDGKNVLNFLFLYVCGHLIKEYVYIWNKYSWYLVLFILLALNIAILFMFFLGGEIGELIWDNFFPYSSSGLLVNSILTFVLFAQINISSKWVNYLASSSLAIYLIHANRPYVIGVIGVISTDMMLSLTNNPIGILMLSLCLSIVIIIGCIIIDKSLTPIWNLLNRVAETIQFNYENRNINISPKS